MDFTSAKMEFALAILKDCIFPNIQLTTQLIQFDHTNRFLMG